MSTGVRIAVLAGALWLAGQSAVLACTPVKEPERDFPAQTEAEHALAEAYYAADDAGDNARKAVAARAWLGESEKARGRDHWFNAFIAERLGLALGPQGQDAEALAAFQRAHDLYAKAFGPGASETVSTGEMSAIALFRLHRIPEALSAAEAASKGSDALYCPDSDQALGTLKTWAQTANSGGDAAEAVRTWSEYAARRLRRFGETDAEAGFAETTTASNQILLGRNADAFALLQKAIPRLVRAKGDGAAETLEARNWEVEALIGLGRFAEARDKAKALIVASTKAAGARAVATFNAEELYLRALQAMNDFVTAGGAFSEIAARRLKAVGEDDPAMLSLMEIGAGLATDAGRYADAEQLRRRLLGAALKTYGDDSPEAIHAYTKLGDLLTDADRSQEARQLMGPVWARIGPNAKTATDFYLGNAYGIALFREEQYAEAERFFRDLSVRIDKALGATSAPALNVKTNLGLAIGGQGRAREAEALLNEVWRARVATLGADHPSTIDAHLNAVRAIAAPERAKEVGEALMAIYQQTLARGGPPTLQQLRVASNMASFAQRVGAYEAAEPLLVTLREGYSAIYGPDDSHTRSASLRLARAYGEQKRPAKAEPLFAEVVAGEEKLAVAGAPPGEALISARAGLGIARTLQGKADIGYPLLAQATRDVLARSGDLRATGSGQDARRQVLIDNRFVFRGALRSGWAYAHMP